MTENQELVTYHANCHCGATKFTVDLPDIRKDKVTKCTCSICTKNGYLLVYPKAEDLKFQKGFDELSAYRFGGASKRHLFCPKCGTSILIDFSTSEHTQERLYMAVNLRTFVDIQDVLEELEYRHFDGANKLKPKYQIPE